MVTVNRCWLVCFSGGTKDTREFDAKVLPTAVVTPETFYSLTLVLDPGHIF